MLYEPPHDVIVSFWAMTVWGTEAASRATATPAARAWIILVLIG